MSARFASFLYEGMIKLPHRALEEISDYFLETALAYVTFLGEKAALDDDDEKLLHASIKQLASRLRVKEPTHDDVRKLATRPRTDQSTSKVFDVDVPQVYVNRLAKLKGQEAVSRLQNKSVKVILSLDGKHQLLDGDESGVCYDAQVPVIVLNFKGLHVDEKMAKQTQIAELTWVVTTLNMALNTVEHELTHAVQYLVLQHLHHKQSDMMGSKHAHTATDKYYTSEAEFGPMVRSAIKIAKSLVQHQRFKPGTPEEDKFLRQFVWDDVPAGKLNAHHEGDRSDFFKSLKKADYERWKKAVKIFMSTYRRERAHG